MKSNEIAAEHQFLSKHYAQNNFYKGKEIVERQLEAMVFRNGHNSKVYKHYVCLTEAGIYARNMKEIIERRILLRATANRFLKDPDK